MLNLRFLIKKQFHTMSPNPLPFEVLDTVHSEFDTMIKAVTYMMPQS